MPPVQDQNLSSAQVIQLTRAMLSVAAVEGIQPAEAALIGLADTGPEEPTQTARDLMHPAQGLPATAPAALLVQRLSQAKDQSVPIVQDGRLIGLVTRSDLIALLARSLPS